MSDDTRAREIRAELDKLAPYPPRDDATPAQVATYLLVRAQTGIATMGLPGAEITPAAVACVGAQFAAAHILRACEHSLPSMARDLAEQVAGAWHDGGEIAEWVWQLLTDLGADADAISKLSQELAEAAPKPAAGVVVDPADLRAALTATGALPDDVHDRLCAAAGVTR